MPQHLGCRLVDPLVGVVAQHLVGIDRVELGILQTIGPQLVDQTDAAPLLGQIEQHPGALATNLLNRAAQLRSAIAAQRPEQIAGEAFRVEADQGRGVERRPADGDGQMLLPAIGRPECDDRRVLGAFKRHTRLCHTTQAASGMALVMGDIESADREDVVFPRQPVAGQRTIHRCNQRGGQQPRKLGQLGDRDGAVRTSGFNPSTRYPDDRRGIDEPRRVRQVADEIGRQAAARGQPDDAIIPVCQSQGRGALTGQDDLRLDAGDPLHPLNSARRDGFAGEDQQGGPLVRADQHGVAASQVGRRPVNGAQGRLSVDLGRRPAVLDEG